MKRLLLISAILMAILLPITSYAGDLGPLTSSPTEVLNNQIETARPIINDQNFVRNGVYRPEQVVNQNPTQTLIPAQGAPIYINNTYNNQAQSTSKPVYKKRVVIKYVKTPAPAPKVITKNITTKAPTTTINNFYTATPSVSSDSTAGNTGKGTNMTNIDPGVVWMVIFGLIAAISIIAIIMDNGRKVAREATLQKLSDEKKAFVEKVIGCTDGDVSGSVSENYVTIDKKLKTVAPGTVALAAATPVTPIINNIVVPQNAWQGYMNGQPNQGQPQNQGQPGQVQVQPGGTPISTISTTITYVTP